MANNLDLGQHFLKDETVLEKIASQVEAKTDEEVLEIGSGPGTLTRALKKHVQNLMCVELDPQFDAPEGVSYVQESAVRHLGKKCYPVIVGNIPYHISEPLLHAVLTCQPRRAVFVVGKKLATLLQEESMLGTYVRNCYDIQQVLDIDRSLFTPPPRVDSSLIILTKKPVEKPVLEVLRTRNTSTVKNALTYALRGKKTKREVRELLADYSERDTPVYQLSTSSFFELLKKL